MKNIQIIKHNKQFIYTYAAHSFLFYNPKTDIVKFKFKDGYLSFLVYRKETRW